VYTLALVWQLRCAPLAVDVGMRVLATDIDDEELQRARNGVYPAGALKELPEDLLKGGFERVNGFFRIRDRFRQGVELRRSDLTRELPEGLFDLVLCRNLAFTYFDESLQAETLDRVSVRMAPGGVLVVGKHEVVPALNGLYPMSIPEGLYIWMPNGS
jgi:chemotaxis protein methyltransferase CheR